MRMHPTATEEELQAASADRARVWRRGRQLRRRRLSVRAGALAAVAVAATVTSVNVLHQDSHPNQVVTGPPAATSGLSGNGAHWVYFRPVYCLLPPAGLQPSRAGRARSASAAAADSADPATTSVANTPRSTESVSEPVILPGFIGSARYVLGPVDLDGRSISTAHVVSGSPAQGYGVEVVFTAAGAGQFNLVASQRFPFYQQNTANPPVASLEAVEVDGVVIAAPSIQANGSDGTAIFRGPALAPFSKQQADQIVQAIRRDLTHP